MLVIAVHGSAVPTAARSIDRLTAAVEALSGIRPLVGHLDAQRPTLAEVAARHPGAVVVPLLLGDGYHRTVDVPAVLAGTGCTLTPGLGGEPDVALALYGRLRDAERRTGAFPRADAVVVAGAGSARPGGTGGTEAAAAGLAALLECDRGPVPVVPAYLTSAAPAVGAALEGLRAAGHRRIAIAAHLLADGRFTRSLAAAGAWTVTEPLAGHPRLARLVLRRYEAARAGGVPRAARLAC